jgi:formylglycine-generating enzyme required for sulfatase activity
MRLGCGIGLAIASGALAIGACAYDRPTGLRSAVPDLVQLRPGAFSYRASGEFARDGRPVRAPLVTVAMTHPLAVMRRQVTAAHYRRCVAAGACPALDRAVNLAASDLPAVRVSWRDAQSYAAWLSTETGLRFRLPTDQEWAYAAGTRLADDALPEDAYGDPGLRALASYEAAARRGTTDREPRPVGSFGANENGLLDIAGNVWEWTTTCFSRTALDGDGAAAAVTVNCGVRIAEGRRRAYMPDFVRDAHAGGCSSATPPSNLGFRLVREEDWWRAFPRLLGPS